MLTIYDSLHGMVYFNRIYAKLVDDYLVNRLRRVRQLSLAHLIYPGATHTRFQHSIGVYALVDRYFDVVRKLEENNIDMSDREIQEQIKIAKIYGLLHDLGHVSFSHDSEQVLNIINQDRNITLTYNDEEIKINKQSNTKPFHERLGEKLANRLIEKYRDEYRNENGENELDNVEFQEHPLISFEAGLDRLDYLMRDSYYTGVMLGSIDTEYILNNIYFIGNWRKKENWRVKNEAKQNIESMLIARHMMFQKVYNHPKVIAAAAILQKCLYKAFTGDDITLNDLIYDGDDVILWKLANTVKNERVRRWCKDIINRRIYYTSKLEPDSSGENQITRRMKDIWESDDDIFIYVVRGKNAMKEKKRMAKLLGVDMIDIENSLIGKLIEMQSEQRVYIFHPSNSNTKK
ncbi:MAG: HD domain-containing protein [Candidatus Micrarchaeota archaeon]|nr:HD domain-containing protein [Candidatus Micrarchaeota archaeon]